MSAQALTLELRQAQAWVTVQGWTTRETVSLPCHWGRHHAGLLRSVDCSVGDTLAPCIG